MKVFECVGIIYSDFECGFICVEIVVYEDFFVGGGMVGVKEVGKVCFEGKDYVVKDGDVIYF